MEELFINKYDQMVEYLTEHNKSNRSYINLFADKTLLELMNQQTRIGIETLNEDFNEILQLDFSKTSNDVLEFHYHKLCSMYPFINEIILNMSSPDDVGGANLNFLNQKVIIFDYGNFFQTGPFIEEYLTPFFFEKVLDLIKSSLNFHNPSDKQIQEWFSDYKQNIMTNIYRFNYYSLPELLLQLQNLPNVITKLRDVGLVILDSPNLLLNQDIKLSHVYDKEGHLTSHTNMKKRKSHNLHQNDQGWYETINIILNNFRNEFNFNLIYTFFDYRRVENLSYIKYKMNDQNFTFDNNSKNFKIKIGDEDRLHFLFSSNSFVEDKQKLYFLEPDSSYYNMDINVFGVVNFLGESKFRFTIFGRKIGFSHSKLMYSQVFIQDKEKDNINNSRPSINII